MTDGNMGIQVAPTAEEIMNAQSVFQKAADAIVGLSSLKASVDALQTQVTQMSDELDRLRKQNAGLEESLYQARTHRFELEDKLNKAQAEAAQATQDKASAQRDAEHWQTSCNAALDKLSNTQRQRDDAEYTIIELQDKLKAAEAKLATIMGVFGVSQAPAVQAAPNVTAQAMADAPPPAEPTPEPPPMEALSEPEPTPVPEVDWNKPYQWDAVLLRYVNI